MACLSSQRVFLLPPLVDLTCDAAGFELCAVCFGCVATVLVAGLLTVCFGVVFCAATCFTGAVLLDFVLPGCAGTVYRGVGLVDSQQNYAQFVRQLQGFGR